MTRGVPKLVLLVWITALIGQANAEVCSTSGSWNYKYCDSGYYCCNNGLSCCSNFILGIGAIIGIVIGSIFFLCICIGVICCIAQSKKRPGTIIHPTAAGGQSIAVVGMTTQQQQQYPPGFQQQQQYPPGFQQQQAYPPPPSYNMYSNPGQAGPAYPPPVMGSNNYQSGDNVMPAKQ